MKDSGNKLAPKNKFLGGKNCDWIGEIPDDWKIIRLKYIADKKQQNSFMDGDWIDSQYVEKNGIRYLTTGNIGDGLFKRQGEGFISEDTFIKLHCKYAYPNDLVISRLNPPFGRSCLLNDDFDKYVIAVDNVILRTQENKKFICFVTQCEGYQKAVGDKTNGTTMKRISRTNLGNVLIPLPPLEEQQQIADFLDNKCSKIDKLLELLTKQVKVLTEYKKSLITETVTKGLNPDKLAPSTKEEKHWKNSGINWIGEIPKDWKIIRLKYICKITTGDEDTQNADNDGEYLFYVRSPIIEHSKRYTFEGESILMAGDGAGAGRIFHHAFGKYAVHQRVYILYNFSYNSSFLYYFLSNMFPQEMDRGSAQTTVPSVRLPMILNFKIPLPPLAEQQQIADFLDNKCSKIDKLLENKNKQIETLKKYKKSLIYEYVTGKKEVTRCGI